MGIQIGGIPGKGGLKEGACLPHSSTVLCMATPLVEIMVPRVREVKGGEREKDRKREGERMGWRGRWSLISEMNLLSRAI